MFIRRYWLNSQSRRSDSKGGINFTACFLSVIPNLLKSIGGALLD
ncbi:hypothetical protein Sps_04843 [Shewanella psychrophila]|uniref:Uncharacterized protein n=1 Tax=Shewanella psychrophila TaxID=225848 RepID=A0A1S6HWI7_9GAMM|nr:hypothetical protein Sps_04843 [Shewanella psychrophila]